MAVVYAFRGSCKLHGLAQGWAALNGEVRLGLGNDYVIAPDTVITYWTDNARH